MHHVFLACVLTFHYLPKLSQNSGKQAFDGQQNRSPLSGEMYIDSPRLPPNATVGVGERLEITCYLSGYPVPQVFWFKDGKQLNEHNPDNDFQVSESLIYCLIAISVTHPGGILVIVITQ